MKRSLMAVLAVTGMALIGGCSTQKTVAMADVPAPVRATFEQQAAGGTFTEVKMEKENGVAVYETHYMKDGKKHEIEVDETGKLLETKECTGDDACCKEEKQSAAGGSCCSADAAKKS